LDYINTIPKNDIAHFEKEGEQTKSLGVAGRLNHYHRLLVEGGNLRHCFFDHDMADFENFMEFVMFPYHVFILVLDEKGYPVGHAALTNMTGKTAMIHFGITRERTTEAHDALSASLDQIFDMKRNNGSSYIETLTGLTPMYNRPARTLIASVGFDPIKVIPKSGYRYWDKKFIDCMLSMRCRNGT